MALGVLMAAGGAGYAAAHRSVPEWTPLSLAALGMAVERKGRRRRPSGARSRAPELSDRAPVQILEEDFTAVKQALDGLRASGVDNLVAHLMAHPEQARELQGRVRLINANRMALAGAGFSKLPAMAAQFPRLAVPPYPEVFDAQLNALWYNRRRIEEEFRYLDAGAQERACLMRCQVGERDGHADFSRVVLILIDITTARRTVEAQMENQEVLRQILARANILLWWARVHREGDLFRWKINVPTQSADSPVYRLATARDRGGLWDVEHAPDLPETARRAEEALRTGRPGYRQEFRVIDAGRTHWLSEDVSIHPVGSDEWSLLGVITEVTERHEAEAARRASEAGLREILERADCLLWRARVWRDGDEIRWPEFDMPRTSLYLRLFGDRPMWEGKKLKLWSRLQVPELADMNRRVWEALLGGAPDYEQEFRVIKPEGTMWLHEHVSVTPAGPDEWRLVGVLMDVTAQRQAEEGRRATEAQLRQILDRADCIVWQSRVTRIGEEYQWRDFRVPDSPLRRIVFGTDPQVKDDELWTLVNVPEMDEMNRRSAAALRSGASSYEQEFRVVQANRTLWLLERTSITRVGPDEWTIVGILIDVTARREAEEARRASEARLRQILERANCMLWQARVQRVDGVFQWTQYRLPASPLHKLIFGTEQHPTADRLWSLVNVPERAEMDRRSTAALLAGESGYDQEFRVVQPERTIWLLERVTLDRVGPDEWAAAGVLIDVTERHQSEEARRKIESQLQQIVERVDCVLWNARVVEREGRMVWSFELPRSRLQRQLFGDKAVSGEIEIYDGLDVPELPEMCRRSDEALRSGSPGYEQEYRVIQPDRTYWLHERVSIAAEGPGQWRLFGVILDVSALKEAELARLRSEERLRQLLDGADCMLWQARVVENAAGGMDWHLYIPRSRLYRNLFGSDPDENSNLMWSELNVPELAVMHARSAEALRSGQAGYEQEFRARRGEQWYWLHEQVTILAVTGGEWRLIGVVTDITARRDAELALAAEKERLAVTLRAMADGVITTDTKGIVQYINRAAGEMLACDNAAIVGRPFGEVCVLRAGGAAMAGIEPCAQVLATDATFDLPAGVVLAGLLGRERRVEGSCVPVHGSDSRLIGTVLVFRDVTERERFEEEIARSAKLESVGILAGGIAHDFNNILTVIMGNITLALLDASDLVRVQSCLRETERAALRARNLTQQLLTFAKGGDPILTAVRMPEAIAEVAEFALHGTRVRCEFDFPKELWPAEVDKGQIGQVVQNLVINSVQAMPEGGTIRIGARNEETAGGTAAPFIRGSFVHLWVADGGLGIRSEHLSKIFDPYFTTKQQGSGLGLATVYSIVKRHHGHVEVESELGRGTTFHLWLPALREQQLDLPPEAADARAPLHGRVLLMDDEETIREMAGLLFKRLGFEIELASDGAEAVNKYQAARDAGRAFDLVIMDLTVPGGMGGREAMERLRRVDPDVKAIVSSGYSSDPVLAHFRDYGFRGVVAKPYELEDLTRVLRDVLG